MLTPEGFNGRGISDKLTLKSEFFQKTTFFQSRFYKNDVFARVKQEKTHSSTLSASQNGHYLEQFGLKTMSHIPLSPSPSSLALKLNKN